MKAWKLAPPDFGEMLHAGASISRLMAALFDVQAATARFLKDVQPSWVFVVTLGSSKENARNVTCASRSDGAAGRSLLGKRRTHETNHVVERYGMRLSFVVRKKDKKSSTLSEKP